MKGEVRVAECCGQVFRKFSRAAWFEAHPEAYLMQVPYTNCRCGKELLYKEVQKVSECSCVGMVRLQ